MTIALPSRAYFDHALWIELAEGRLVDEPLRTAISRAELIPVLSTIHLIEMITAERKSPGSGVRVAQYLDRLLGGPSKPRRLVRQMDDLSRDQIRTEIDRCLDRPRSPTPDPFAHDFSEILPDAGGDPASIDNMSMVEMVAVAAEQVPMQKYLADRRTLPEQRRYVRRVRAENRRIERDEIIEKWVVPEFPGEPDDDALAVLRVDFDLARCPVLKIDIAYHNGWNLASAGEDESDMEDQFHLVGAAHSDLAFVDRRVRAALDRGRYDPLPSRNGKFPRWLEQLDSYVSERRA